MPQEKSGFPMRGENLNMIQQEICTKLDIIETEHRIRIPFAVESGSRAWGFASADSDYDCRFIYVRPKDDYLALFPPKDTLDYPPDKIFDLSGWDVRKVIVHLVKSNAVMLEWLRSGHIYRKNDQFAAELWSLGQSFFHPTAVTWHYLSLAANKLREIKEKDSTKVKTYFYVLRPLACARFILQHQEIPFMEYSRNLQEISVPEEIRSQIEQLLARKAQSNEADLLPKQEALLGYFDQEIAEIEAWLSWTKFEKKQNVHEADDCFRKVLNLVENHE